MFGIKSMRQTIKEIEVNVAYRWFLGLDFYDKVPHFSTFGNNYKTRFIKYQAIKRKNRKSPALYFRVGLLSTDS